MCVHVCVCVCVQRGSHGWPKRYYCRKGWLWMVSGRSFAAIVAKSGALPPGWNKLLTRLFLHSKGCTDEHIILCQCCKIFCIQLPNMKSICELLLCGWIANTSLASLDFWHYASCEGMFSKGPNSKFIAFGPLRVDLLAKDSNRNHLYE